MVIAAETAQLGKTIFDEGKKDLLKQIVGIISAGLVARRRRLNRMVNQPAVTPNEVIPAGLIFGETTCGEFFLIVSHNRGVIRCSVRA